MKLQFDANQQFQLDAVAAIADLFDGQPRGAREHAVINMGGWGVPFAVAVTADEVSVASSARNRPPGVESGRGRRGLQFSYRTRGGGSGRCAMQPIVERHRTEIAALCRRFHVRRVEVFGSAVRDDFDPARSDVDLLVEFEPNAPVSPFELYFGFKESVETLLGRPVDLLIASAVRNPYLRAQIERSKESLYAA